MARAAEVVIKEIDSLLDELGESIDAPLPASVVCDAVRSMSKVRNRTEAAFTQLVGQLDASRAYSDEGARSLRTWLCWKLRLSKAPAAAVGSNARDLRTMPGTAEAFARGELTPAQVRLLRLAHDAHPDAFAEGGEQFLLTKAAELWHDHFARVVKHWIYVNNPDDEEERARRRYEGRRVYASTTFEDTVRTDGHLDVIGGAIFINELKRIEELLFEEDCKEAEARLGHKPGLLDLARTGPQRRADALVEMARRSYSLRDGSPRPRPLVSVVIDHPTLNRICQLANGTIVTPGEILPLFCDCDIERVVFGAASRVIDVGQRQRFFSGATRRAVELRDLECTHAACDVPYEDCEIDHVQPWALGGATSQVNGRVHCPHHNRSRPRSQLPDREDDPPA